MSEHRPQTTGEPTPSRVAFERWWVEQGAELKAQAHAIARDPIEEMAWYAFAAAFHPAAAPPEDAVIAREADEILALANAVDERLGTYTNHKVHSEAEGLRAIAVRLRRVLSGAAAPSVPSLTLDAKRLCFRSGFASGFASKEQGDLWHSSLPVEASLAAFPDLPLGAAPTTETK